MARANETLRADAARLGTRARFGWLSFAALAMADQGFFAVLLLRLQQQALTSKRTRIAEAIRRLGIILTSADLVPGCQAGPGLVIRHSVGIVLGSGAKLGSDCTLLQNVTLGERHADGSGHHEYPSVGDRVVISAGACVLGGVRIGNDVVVGANAVVLSNLASGVTAVGVPATSISAARNTNVAL